MFWICVRVCLLLSMNLIAVECEWYEQVANLMMICLIAFALLARSYLGRDAIVFVIDGFLPVWYYILDCSMVLMESWHWSLADFKQRMMTILWWAALMYNDTMHIWLSLPLLLYIFCIFLGSLALQKSINELMLAGSHFISKYGMIGASVKLVLCVCLQQSIFFILMHYK